MWNRTLPRQEYPCKKVNHENEDDGTGPCSEASLPAERARPARSRGGKLETFPSKSENQALIREESLLMQNVNRKSESDITSPCSEARHIAGRESATCALRAESSSVSFAKSESRTSPREESLPMQHVINHKTARGSRSEERHIAGRESTTCARKEEEKAGVAGWGSAERHLWSPVRCEPQERSQQ